MTKALRTGYFFGTFNPPHWGHLMLAECAREQLSLDRVVFVPSGRPPHRLDDTSLADPVDRLEMVRRAISGHPGFEVWAGEIHKTTPCYTLESLENLDVSTGSQAALPSYLIMGADTLATVPSWHRAAELMARCVFASAQRPQSEVFSHPSMNIHWLEMPSLDLSATQIRARRAVGKSIRYWVPEAVRIYIQDNLLYRENVGDGLKPSLC